MTIKYLYVDNNGKISLTRKELDEIMTQCYNDGYADAKKLYNYPSWTSVTSLNGSSDYSNSLKTVEITCLNQNSVDGVCSCQSKEDTVATM